jgi:hypothetical protein
VEPLAAIEERTKTGKTTARSFRFTPQEWDMIEAEASRLNMSKAFFVHLAVTNAIGKFTPLPRLDYADFLPKGVVKSEGTSIPHRMAYGR